MITNERHPLRAEPIWQAREQPVLAALLDMALDGWRVDAACARADWSLFEPADERDGDRCNTPLRARAAAAYCAECPVRDRCRDEADTRRELGVWAGAWRTGTGKDYQVRAVPPAGARSAA